MRRRMGAVSCRRYGARIESDAEAIRVVARTDAGIETSRGRLVIGADGVTSAVSRAIGNTLKDGAMAVSMRAYYRDVKVRGAPIRVYFDRDYFPGYGWLFVDDGGFANIGMGYTFDRNFPLTDLSAGFRRFIANEYGPNLCAMPSVAAVSWGARRHSIGHAPSSVVASGDAGWGCGESG